MPRRAQKRDVEELIVEGLNLDDEHVEKQLAAMNSSQRAKVKEVIIKHQKVSKIPDLAGRFNNLTVVIINGSNIENPQESIACLPKEIQELSLDRNGICVCPDLSMFQNLQSLCLSHNKLESIPTGYFPYKALEKLYVYNNILEEMPDLSNYNKLQLLNAGNNKITDVKNIHASLRELYVQQNNISKMPSFRGLPNLWRVNLSDNNIQELTEPFPNKLSMVELQNNPITEIHRHVVEDLTQTTFDTLMRSLSKEQLNLLKSPPKKAFRNGLNHLKNFFKDQDETELQVVKENFSEIGDISSIDDLDKFINGDKSPAQRAVFGGKPVAVISPDAKHISSSGSDFDSRGSLQLPMTIHSGGQGVLSGPSTTLPTVGEHSITPQQSNSTLEALERSLQEKDNEIRALKESVQEKEGTINQQKEQLVTLAGSVKEKESEIRTLMLERTALNCQLSKLEKSLAEKDSQIQKFADSIKSLTELVHVTGKHICIPKEAKLESKSNNLSTTGNGDAETSNDATQTNHAELNDDVDEGETELVNKTAEDDLIVLDSSKLTDYVSAEDITSAGKTAKTASDLTSVLLCLLFTEEEMATCSASTRGKTPQLNSQKLQALKDHVKTVFKVTEEELIGDIKSKLWHCRQQQRRQKKAKRSKNCDETKNRENAPGTPSADGLNTVRNNTDNSLNKSVQDNALLTLDICDNKVKVKGDPLRSRKMNLHRKLTIDAKPKAPETDDAVNETKLSEKRKVDLISDENVGQLKDSEIPPKRNKTAINNNGSGQSERVTDNLPIGCIKSTQHVAVSNSSSKTASTSKPDRQIGQTQHFRLDQRGNLIRQPGKALSLPQSVSSTNICVNEHAGSVQNIQTGVTQPMVPVNQLPSGHIPVSQEQHIGLTLTPNQIVQTPAGSQISDPNQIVLLPGGQLQMKSNIMPLGNGLSVQLPDNASTGQSVLQVPINQGAFLDQSLCMPSALGGLSNNMALNLGSVLQPADVFSGLLPAGLQPDINTTGLQLAYQPNAGGCTSQGFILTAPSNSLGTSDIVPVNQQLIAEVPQPQLVHASVDLQSHPTHSGGQSSSSPHGATILPKQKSHVQVETSKQEEETVYVYSNKLPCSDPDEADVPDIEIKVLNKDGQEVFPR